MIGMLIAGGHFAVARPGSRDRVIRFDEQLVGQCIRTAGIQKVFERSKDGGLVLKEIHHFHRGAGFVIIKELAGMTGSQHGFVMLLYGLPS